MANEKQVLTNCQRLIDPSVPIRDLTAMKSMYDAIALDGIIKALKEAPTVDAVEVVRCKDCKNWKKGNFKGGDTKENLEWGGSCPLSRFARYESDFCSYGERRNDGKSTSA